MTLITCNIFQSGTSVPIDGYINVTATNYLTDATKFYTATPVKYPLVAGSVVIDLIPTDIAKTAYKFEIYQNGSALLATPDLRLNSFEATVPYSPTAINLNTLAPQSGLRYDRRDASLLTLARLLTSNDSFMGFLGSKLWGNKGLWSSSVVYKQGDVVQRNGSSYQYVSSTQQAALVPETNPDAWQLIAQAGAPALVGTIILYATAATLPANFMRCDGSAVSRATYSALFALIGIAYGAGNGTTTFNLPSIAAVGASSYIIRTGV